MLDAECGVGDVSELYLVTAPHLSSVGWSLHDHGVETPLSAIVMSHHLRSSETETIV